MKTFVKPGALPGTILGVVLVSLTLALVGPATAATATEASAAAKPAAPKTAAAWQRAAIQDINAAWRITLDNHPGTYDPANPGFRKQLDQARRQGLAMAAKVRNSAGYVAAIQSFNVGLGDGHAGAYATLDAGVTPQGRWPGFVTVWRGDALYVHASLAGGPPVGARVVSCDGSAIKALITRNVFAFDGNINQAGDWWVYAQQVFIDEGNPFIRLPRRCEFDTGPGSKPLQQTLVWQAQSDQSRQWLKASNSGDVLEAGLTEPRPGVFWITMPTFQPNETQRATYRALNQQVSEQRQRFLNAEALVMDLRHNRGGSSAWSLDFAGALWGGGRVERRMNAWHSDVAVWWRASRDNTAFLGEAFDDLTRQGQLETAAWIKAVGTGMQAALVRGDKFYIPAEEHDATSQPTPQPGAAAEPKSDPAADLPTDPPAFTRPVYVIISGTCGSACLDAVDYFTRFPNTRLIGAPSGSDSTYMEVRYQALASGLAKVTIPNKVYVNRPRANGQVYLPDIYLKELVWSQANFLKLVEGDLAAKRGLK